MFNSTQQFICPEIIDEMASNVLTTFVRKKLRTKTFSLEINKSTLPDNQALLLSYVRSIDMPVFDSVVTFWKTQKVGIYAVNKSDIGRQRLPRHAFIPEQRELGYCTYLFPSCRVRVYFI